MNINEKIKQLRKQQGFSQQYVADRIGIERSAYSRWETESTKTIRADYLQALAKALHTTVDYLISDDEQKPTTDHSHWIPVLGKVSAGIPSYMAEDIIDQEEISNAYGECFALMINGDSMAPRMNIGDVVIVRKQSDVDSGDIAIVSIEGDYATTKKVIKYPNGISLVSLNPIYEPKFFSSDEIESKQIVILGKVIELRAKF